jgi:hypothetical protein
MRSSFRTPITALAASFFAVTTASCALAQANSPAEPPATGWMQHWAVDREALLDAKLGGLKAGLRLTPDQEKLWPPFESAVRDAAKMRMEHMQGMMERMDEMRRTDNDMEEGEGMSPVDRLDRMASGLTQAGAALQKVADAAKPLYASLDDSQKRIFGFLSHEMMTMGHGPGGMGPRDGHRRYHEEEGGPEEE